jgi:hypothetical protein
MTRPSGAKLIASVEGRPGRLVDLVADTGSRAAAGLGVMLGSLGRGMQADGVWANLPATTGPIAAVPARGCPGGVATRPGAQSAKGTGYL